MGKLKLKKKLAEGDQMGGCKKWVELVKITAELYVERERTDEILIDKIGMRLKEKLEVSL